MTLHLVEIPLVLKRLHIWAAERALGRRGALDEGLALHHLLGEVFGPAVLQPFRLLVALRAEHGKLYAYAATDAEGLRATASVTAGPGEAEVLPLDRLRSIPRPEATWQDGQRLGFDLRVRPVVRLLRGIEGPDGSFAKGAEVDCFLPQALGPGEPRPREAVYLDWLDDRLGDAASIERDATRLASFRRSRVQRGKRRIEGPDAVFHGTLTVRDPAAFAQLLVRGVGRHRAYGYGMLLLRPPQRRG
ncbi:type I-E CRISPR-associated protein Cas6/Cse3/CasE [Roseovarius sp. ZX-A-9]|uniref:type I-E CRISPR-associated protein Cas6/Cse3/CasE n=1 Tax=Roseovarius sp. ZX-A-9 TaxID=3014783 RepID=UPI00233154B2|nr:type I-E CRISPR-associated protein Cas6/Cse3/CasE [Roseovarius sp. ZX-A-9]